MNERILINQSINQVMRIQSCNLRLNSQTHLCFKS